MSANKKSILFNLLAILILLSFAVFVTKCFNFTKSLELWLKHSKTISLKHQHESGKQKIFLCVFLTLYASNASRWTYLQKMHPIGCSSVGRHIYPYAYMPDAYMLTFCGSTQIRNSKTGDFILFYFIFYFVLELRICVLAQNVTIQTRRKNA